MAQYVSREAFSSKVYGENEVKPLRNEKELNVTDNKGDTLSFFLLTSSLLSIIL
jgi:hypothetical protein